MKAVMNARRSRSRSMCVPAYLAGCWFSLLALSWVAYTQPVRAQSSMEPGVRYFSLKSDRVDARADPDPAAPVKFEFRRAGLPVAVSAAAAGWTLVTDKNGAGGWVPSNLLSRRRTAIVERADSEGGAGLSLRSDDRQSAAVVAILEVGLLVNLMSCDGGWCRISVDDRRGYVEVDHLWGVGAGETFN